MAFADYVAACAADSPWGAWNLTETSGTTLADSSGAGRSLTTTGTPTLAESGPGGGSAVGFPQGAGTYATSSAPTSATVYTLEFWVYLNAYPTNSTSMMGIHTGDNNGKSVAGVNPDGTAFFWFYAGVSGGVRLAGPTLSLGAWHHVVASIGPAGGKVRVDKVTGGTSTRTSDITTAYLIRVRQPVDNTGGPNFQRLGWGAAHLAGLRFYESQLSDARTDAHYDAMLESGAPTLTLAATLPRTTASLAFDYTPPSADLTLDATLPGLAANLSLDYTPPATFALDATLPPLAADLAFDYAGPVALTLDARLPGLSAALGFDYAPPAVSLNLDATLPGLAADLAFTVVGAPDFTLAVDATLPAFGTDAVSVWFDYDPPVATPPPTYTPGRRVEKAAAYPMPVLENGRIVG